MNKSVIISAGLLFASVVMADFLCSKSPRGVGFCSSDGVDPANSDQAGWYLLLSIPNPASSITMLIIDFEFFLVPVEGSAALPSSGADTTKNYFKDCTGTTPHQYCCASADAELVSVFFHASFSFLYVLADFKDFFILASFHSLTNPLEIHRPEALTVFRLNEVHVASVGC